MEENKIKWCLSLKDGLRIVEPNEILAKSYLEESKSSLNRAQKDFTDSDLLWATVVIYYAEYYALYSFLQKIGIKCENHFCSILAATLILGEDKTKLINDHKDRRIDAQYYMKAGRQKDVEKMLQEAKIFISVFDNIVSNLNKIDIDYYRNKLKKIKH